MEINNNFLEENYTNPVDSSHLSYAKTAKVDELVSIATNKKADSNSQCVDNEVPALKRVSKPHGKGKGKKIKSNDPTSLEHMSNNVCNTQITYDNNQTVDLKSWDSKFNSILLHSSMEQLATDAINIKKSLWHIGKYILNEKIEQGKANSIADLRNVGEATWNFISSIYEAGWDEIIADKDNFSFRWKVKIQFNPLSIGASIFKKDKVTAKPALILSFSPPILAKPPKEVNTIFKYFKKPSKNLGKKLYAQASSPSSNITREILKIKEIFPKLQDKKFKRSSQGKINWNFASIWQPRDLLENKW